MNDTYFTQLAQHPILVATGWTLVHFLWQAGLIAALVSMLLVILQRSSAQVRYVVACIGLGLMLATCGSTLAYLVSNTGQPEWGRYANAMNLVNHSNLRSEKIGDSQAIAADVNVNHIAANSSPTTPRSFDKLSLDFENRPANSTLWLPTLQSQYSEIDGDSASSFSIWSQRLRFILPAIVTLWSLGVVGLAIKLMSGWIQVRKWQRSGDVIDDSKVSEVLSRLSDRLGITFPVQVFDTLDLQVPAVVGWLKPTILLPAQLLTGLTQAELESVLAHELAHIRRYDYLINLIQSVIETLLFYHPAVWWLSRRIRLERENCCDDLAVAACGNPVALASALTRLEELRCQPSLAMSADGNSLLLRIQRLVGVRTTRSDSWWPAGLISLASLTLLLGSMWLSTAANLRAGEKYLSPEAEIQVKSDDDHLPLQTVEKDNGVLQRVSLNAKAEGRSPQELLERWRMIPQFDSAKTDSITDSESLVSAEKSVWIGNAVEAKEIVFNLPEGSKIRAEFHGEKVEVKQTKNGATVIVTHGRVELIDNGGVIRAWASPDGGAEQIVAQCREEAEEYVIRLAARRLQPDAVYPNPPVQSVVNPETGAAENEEHSPHGAVRYEIKSSVETGKFRFKINWRHDVKRTQQEAEVDPEKENSISEAQIPDGAKISVPMKINGKAGSSVISGKLAKELLHAQEVEIPFHQVLRKSLLEMLESGQLENLAQSDDSTTDVTHSTEDSVLPNVSTRLLNAESQKNNDWVPSDRIEIRLPPKNDDHSKGWGKIAPLSGLRTRLTLNRNQADAGVDRPTEFNSGDPISFNLEVKNFGDKPMTVDKKQFQLLKKLYAVDSKGQHARIKWPNQNQEETNKGAISKDVYVADNVILQPGESLVLWNDLNVAPWFDLQPGSYHFRVRGAPWAMHKWLLPSNEQKLTIKEAVANSDE